MNVRARSRFRTSRLPVATAGVLKWGTASQSVCILVDSGVFDDLRDELLRRIPIHNPDWTDYNASDPGVTLVELLAYLAEDLLNRFNQLAAPTCSRVSRRLCTGHD